MARIHVTMTFGGCMAILLAMLVASAADAATTRTQRIQSRVALTQLAEGVKTSTAHLYGAKDDRGAPLEGLKVVQVDGRNVGVYHAPGGGRFNIYVATSQDLMRWTRRARLDDDASQATIFPLPGGAILVAYEKTHLGDLLPRPELSLPLIDDALKILDDPLNRIRIRLRYYRSVDDLLDNRVAREFTAPRKLSPTAEGTPSITSAVLRRGRITRSRIEVGFHWFANGKGDPHVDRRATAVLTNFRTWTAQARPDLDAKFLRAPILHDGFAAPPSGSIGDRDPIVMDGVRMELHEAQYTKHDYATWRPFVLDTTTGISRPLQLLTDGASRAFGNPTATELVAPSGRRAVFFSAYVFSEGAARGEAGPLIYYTER